MTYTVSSRSNQTVIDATKLKDKKRRDEAGVFFFEGMKLFNEALKCGIEIASVFVREDIYQKNSNLFSSFTTYVVNSSVYDKLTDESSPQGIFCIAKKMKIHKFEASSKEDVNESRFALCSVRDPGNLGTIIRTADAFKIDRLILSSDCADIYNPKAIRASMGSLFRQKISVCTDMTAEINNMKALGYNVLAAALGQESKKLNEINIDNKTCFVVGNEGHGISDDIIDACSGIIIIPMNPNTESLNVSSASSVLMWEMYKNCKSD